jgi:hypothetical protein
VLVVISTGILLQVKKEFEWIQPSTQKIELHALNISFDEILLAASSVQEAKINDWADIDRLDVRPNKGIIKIQSKSHWEIQISTADASVLQTAYRRSDTIEAIHDGSWFFDGAKLWIFLPVAIILLLIWLSGCIMLFTTLRSKFKKRHYQQTR